MALHKGAVSHYSQQFMTASPLSFSSYETTLSAQFNIPSALDGGNDIYSCAGRIQQFLDSLKMPGKSESSTGPAKLVVADSEQNGRQSSPGSSTTKMWSSLSTAQ